MRHLYMGLIVPATVLIPIIVMLLRFRALPREMRILFYYLLVTMLMYIVSSSLALRHHSNIFIIHADTIIESIFLLRFFQVALHGEGDRRRIGWVMIGFIVFCGLDLCWLQGPSHYNSYSRPLECILILSLSCLYWWRQGMIASWSGIAMNWIVSGLILYFSSAFFLFLFSNLLMNYGLQVNELAWNLHATMVLIMYLLITIGIFKCSH